MLPSGLLKPIAVAGNPSVTRFTQSSWTCKAMMKRVSIICINKKQKNSQKKMKQAFRKGLQVSM